MGIRDWSADVCSSDLAQLTSGSGFWNYGVALGYSRRTFIAPETGIFAFVDGARDENYYLNLFVGRRLDEKSGVDANVYANYFDSSVAGTIDVYNMGAYASYNRDFTNRLRGIDRKSTRLNSSH